MIDLDAHKLVNHNTVFY